MSKYKSLDDSVVSYINRYGGFCRDCADARDYGICDHTGLPCDPDKSAVAIKHVLKAVHYGIKHGYIKPGASS